MNGSYAVFLGVSADKHRVYHGCPLHSLGLLVGWQNEERQVGLPSLFEEFADPGRR